jgi:hypothetical protein
VVDDHNPSSLAIFSFRIPIRSFNDCSWCVYQPTIGSGE